MPDDSIGFGKAGPADDASDRGEAKYFHGRRQILNDFAISCRRAAKHCSGTTFLVQGAPGAGKTALLKECSKRASIAGWQVATVGTIALWDLHTLRSALGADSEKSVADGPARKPNSSIVKSEEAVNQAVLSTLDLLKGGTGKLLLVLDEAQMLFGDPLNERQTLITRHVLGRIHNGELDRPVILLAGGLGTSKRAFESFDISRFEKRCDVSLGPLDIEAERAVLEDWLKKEGGAKDDTKLWIDAIAKETQGWPQHIMSYVDPALTQLSADGKLMTAQGLETVIRKGRVFREAYYRGRVAGVGRTPLILMSKVLSKRPATQGVLKEDFLSPLARHYGHHEAERLIYLALHKGVLDERDDLYAVPIAPMHNWLISKYAKLELPECLFEFKSVIRHHQAKAPDWNRDPGTPRQALYKPRSKWSHTGNPLRSAN